jgi:hypothetical protein
MISYHVNQEHYSIWPPSCWSWLRYYIQGRVGNYIYTIIYALYIY